MGCGSGRSFHAFMIARPKGQYKPPTASLTGAELHEFGGDRFLGVISQQVVRADRPVS
jgi:hypothetical protein